MVTLKDAVAVVFCLYWVCFWAGFSWLFAGQIYEHDNPLLSLYADDTGKTAASSFIIALSPLVRITISISRFSFIYFLEYKGT